jgi:hypothetical protein
LTCHNDGDAGRLRDPESPPEGLEAVLRDDLRLDAHLHTEHDVPVLPSDPSGQVRVRVVEVAVLSNGQMAQTERGDVNESEDAGVGPRYHVLSETRKLAAPVLPASQSVVTPVAAHTGSVSIPRS